MERRSVIVNKELVCTWIPDSNPDSPEKIEESEAVNFLDKTWLPDLHPASPKLAGLKRKSKEDGEEIEVNI